MYFIFRDKRYEEAEKPTFAEMTFAEGKWSASIGDWTSAQARMTTIYFAIKRADPKLLSWDALLNLGPDDFDMHWPELEEPDPAADPESWPLDPTDAVTQTAPQRESSQTVTANLDTQVNSPYFDPNSSGSSPQYYDSPPALSTDYP